MATAAQPLMRCIDNQTVHILDMQKRDCLTCGRSRASTLVDIKGLSA
ncbi:Uncharacterised protein [Halioglobus japonicus]|nr:Uncharacterised protein [Halioglobus japonicus]